MRFGIHRAKRNPGEFRFGIDLVDSQGRYETHPCRFCGLLIGLGIVIIAAGFYYAIAETGDAPV